MGKRSTSRRLAMQAIYQAEISNNSIEESLKNLFEAEKFIGQRGLLFSPVLWRARVI